MAFRGDRRMTNGRSGLATRRNGRRVRTALFRAGSGFRGEKWTGAGRRRLGLIHGFGPLTGTHYRELVPAAQGNIAE